MNSARRSTHVQRLTSVFFHVDAFDFNSELAWAPLSIDGDIEISINADWFVILGSLEILWHIWIEVILPSETTVGSDRTI